MANTRICTLRVSGFTFVAEASHLPPPEQLRVFTLKRLEVQAGIAPEILKDQTNLNETHGLFARGRVLGDGAWPLLHFKNASLTSSDDTPMSSTRF